MFSNFCPEQDSWYDADFMCTDPYEFKPLDTKLISTDNFLSIDPFSDWIEENKSIEFGTGFSNNDDVVPDGILYLDDAKPEHDGVLYLTDERNYVAADTPYQNNDNSLNFFQQSFPSTTPTNYFSLVNTSPLDQTKLPSEFKNFNNEQSYSLYDNPALQAPNNQTLGLNQGIIPNPLFPLSLNAAADIESVPVDISKFIPPKTELIFNSKDSYFKSPLRQEQLRRYREKKSRRHYQQINQKKSYHAKNKLRNSKGRFIKASIVNSKYTTVAV